MTDQWIELNSELYAVAMAKAKKMPRYRPGRMYQGVAWLKQARSKAETAIRKAMERWRQ